MLQPLPIANLVVAVYSLILLLINASLLVLLEKWAILLITYAKHVIHFLLIVLYAQIQPHVHNVKTMHSYIVWMENAIGIVQFQVL